MREIPRILAVTFFVAFTMWQGSTTALAGERETRAVNDDREIVVVLHGLGRSRAAMWMLAWRFEQAGFRVENFGYQSMRSTSQQTLQKLQSRIDACCTSTSHKVHFVGHSLGGLIVRAYLAQHPMPNLGRVVLLGTPNRGTQLVDRYRDEWWFRVLGLAAKELGTQMRDLPRSLPKPVYPVGVIAGARQSFANEHLLPGEDDGLVTVASTKLAGMSDFIVMPTSHFAMRFNRNVAKQTINFLKSGHFQHRGR